MNVDTKLNIRVVRLEELGQAAALVARGMRDNPIHVAAFGEDADTRERRLGAVFGTALPLVSPKGALLGAYTGGTLVGVAGRG
jgi:hypothetical protein